ncbi:MAG: HPP family protein [Chitinophagales bacterium]
MDKNTSVAVIMTKKVIVADLKTKFSAALKLFLDYQIYHLPVVYDDKLLGIVSVKDALKAFSERAKDVEDNVDDVITLEDIMTHEPTTVDVSATLGDITEILSNAKFRSLPVVEEGKIVGIISNKDLAVILNGMLKDA